MVVVFTSEVNHVLLRKGRDEECVPFVRCTPAAAAGEATLDAAALDDLARLHHAGREDLGLGIAVHGARFSGGLEHAPGLVAVAGQRLGADLVAAQLGEHHQ